VPYCEYTTRVLYDRGYAETLLAVEGQPANAANYWAIHAPHSTHGRKTYCP